MRTQFLGDKLGQLDVKEQDCCNVHRQRLILSVFCMLCSSNCGLGHQLQEYGFNYNTNSLCIATLSQPLALSLHTRAHSLYQAIHTPYHFHQERLKSISSDELVECVTPAELEILDNMNLLDALIKHQKKNTKI
ncbi:hypothetical protein Tco_1345135 [Tanacetum coccineum]